VLPDPDDIDGDFGQGGVRLRRRAREVLLGMR